MRQSFSNIIIAATVFMVGCMVLITVAYIREADDDGDQIILREE